MQITAAQLVSIVTTIKTSPSVVRDSEVIPFADAEEPGVTACYCWCWPFWQPQPSVAHPEGLKVPKHARLGALPARPRQLLAQQPSGQPMLHPAPVTRLAVSVHRFLHRESPRCYPRLRQEAVVDFLL